MPAFPYQILGVFNPRVRYPKLKGPSTPVAKVEGVYRNRKVSVELVKGPAAHDANQLIYLLTYYDGRGKGTLLTAHEKEATSRYNQQLDAMRLEGARL